MKKEEEILKSALELFVNKGFHGSSTSAIAENAGVSNGTLFHYYKSKATLIQHLHNVVKSEQIESISMSLDEENDIKEQFRLIWKQSIQWALQNESKYKFLFQYKFSPYRQKHKSNVTAFKNNFFEIMERGIQQKLVAYLPPEYIFEVTNGSVYGMVEYLKSDPVKFRTPEFMKQSFENYWKSIAP